MNNKCFRNTVSPGVSAVRFQCSSTSPARSSLIPPTLDGSSPRFFMLCLCRRDHSLLCVSAGSRVQQTSSDHVSAGRPVVRLDQVGQLLCCFNSGLCLYALTSSVWGGLVQGGPLGVLPGHLADDLQRAGAPPRPHEGEVIQTEVLRNLNSTARKTISK